MKSMGTNDAPDATNANVVNTMRVRATILLGNKEETIISRNEDL